ncbi:MAG: flagellar hook-basal body complex protein FliE [Solirubrobacteraceae bacterium]
MIVPPVGAVTGGLSLGGTEALTQSTTAIAPGAEVATAPPRETGAVQGGESEGFGGALGEAISALEKSQQSADSASQALATGTVKDPESAIVTVEDAQMGMELAAQLRSKATEAAQTIFQTQV